MKTISEEVRNSVETHDNDAWCPFVCLMIALAVFLCIGINYGIMRYVGLV